LSSVLLYLFDSVELGGMVVVWSIMLSRAVIYRLLGTLTLVCDAVYTQDGEKEKKKKERRTRKR
jgi:hypothetical protein